MRPQTKRSVKFALAGTVIMVVGLGGCSGNTDEVDTSSTKANIAGIATALRESLTLAKAYPDLSKQHVATAIGVLESAQEYPFGEYQTTYDQLVAGCKELQGMVDGSSDPGATGKKIDEILALSTQLPQLGPGLFKE